MLPHAHRHADLQPHVDGPDGAAPDVSEARQSSSRRLAIVFGLVVVYMVAEVVGGLMSHSLALLADAGHMLSDAASLGLALFAIRMARRPRSPEKTYGYQRTEILAALANGVTLVAVAILILVEAFERLRNPLEIDGRTMMWIAFGGLVVNLAGLWILHAGRGASLNVRGAWLHVLADTLGSVQVLVAGILIQAFGWNIADPIASALIAVLVAWSSWTLLRESVNVLMEGTPRHIDSREVAAALREIDGVVGLHDLHIWTITSGFDALSVHVRVGDRDRSTVLRDMRRILRDRFGIGHSTVQLEGDGDCEECGTSSCG